jgi:hypothetical protein
MPYVLIRHKVKDYTKWKTVFDAHKDKRESVGEKTYQIFHTSLIPKTLCSSLNGIIWRTLVSL